MGLQNSEQFFLLSFNSQIHGWQLQLAVEIVPSGNRKCFSGTEDFCMSARPCNAISR